MPIVTTWAGSISEWLAQETVLTPIERRILFSLAQRFGKWVPVAEVARDFYRQTPDPDMLAFDMRGVRTHIWRLRQKLADTPWRIENRYRHGVYRLVAA